MRGDGMAHFAKLVIAAVLSLVGVCAHAGYAQLKPPTGWVSGGGVGGSFNGAVGAASNSATLAANGNVLTNASLNVGGRAVTVPASMRFAANAGRFAANFIVANPYVRVGLTIASWLAIGKLVYDETDGLWKRITETQQDATEYDYVIDDVHANNSSSACNAWVASLVAIDGIPRESNANSTETRCCFSGAYWSNYCSAIQRVQMCPTGSVYVDGKCMVKGSTLTPLTPDQAADELGKIPMPDGVPLEVPAPLPIELPQTQPVFVPTGNPVQNPNYNPNAEPSPQNKPWLQPAVRVVPAPTPENPWQVDLQPVDRPVDSGEPSPDPKVEPLPDPDSPPDPNQPKDEQKEETPDFCAQHPEALACAELDTPPDTDLPTSEKSISVTPDSGWGADNATCPQPRVLHVQGQEILIPYDLFCMYMQGLRPIILAMAWLSAAFILVGARESS